MKRSLLVLLALALLPAWTLAQAPLCNPGDPEGKPGCPSGECDDLLLPRVSIPVIRAVDPNEIIGRVGYDTTRKWVSAKQILEYKVLFENDPEFATAPAQNVTIYVPIDSKLNPASLRLGDFGFGSFNFSVPANTSVYTNRLDVRDSLGVFVDITAGLDVANRRAFWIFQSIDPATGLAATLPADAGFLPVNDSLIHNGEGYVNFSILPLSSSKTTDTVSAQASIIFDIEEVIETNIWKNTIDAGGPSSRVDELPPTVKARTFEVAWKGEDDEDGVGVRGYNLYVSENDSPFSLYQSNISETSTLFTGAHGNKYSFFTLSTDLVGNQELMKINAEASVTIEYDPLPVRWLFFEANTTGEGTVLEWATVWEVNTSYFVVQRSVDGINFTDLGVVSAAGTVEETQNYHFTDNGVASLDSKTIYYRLWQVDLDGVKSYSKIISIQWNGKESEPAIKAYPNPFRQTIALEIMNVTTTSDQDQVSLFSVDGKRIYRKSLGNINGTTILLDSLPQMSPGIYILITSLGGKYYTIRMVKE